MKSSSIVLPSAMALLLISVFCPVSVCSACVATASCSPSDLAALHSMAAAFPPPLFAGWQLAAAHNVCCGHWGPLTINCSFCFTPNNLTQKHMTTSASGVGRVTELEIDLMSHTVEGIRPIGIPISLCSLSALSSLRLVGNSGKVVSGPIPDCIGNNLTHLVHLDISVNSTTGSIPLSLVRLPSLQFLDLHGNTLSGAFPPALVLSHLVYLDLNQNSFTGPIPSTLNSFTHLAYLDLSYNSFSDPIPSLLNLTHLTSLNLRLNALSGPLPTLNTPKLVSLNLDHNHISGSLSPLFQASNLTSLHSMSISDNELNGVIPNFDPFHLSSLVSHIDLSTNLLSGSLPDSICGLTNLSYLSLSSNTLSGQINKCNFTKFEWLDMSANLFTGPFPDWLGSNSNLWYLSTRNNNLSGSLPNSWQNLTFLHILDLSGNSIRMPSQNPGAPKLPCWLLTFSKLEELYLSSTQLQATDLDGICSSHCSAIGGVPLQLTVLDLSNNLFNSGNLHCFPKIFVFRTPDSESSAEPVLNLSGNPLELDLSNPNAVKLLPKSLRSLDLSSCRLRGHLSKLFFERFAPSLKTLYLSHNSLEGQIPAELGNMSELEDAGLSNNLFTGVSTLTNGGLAGFNLDLSNNRLAGNLSSLLSSIVPNITYCPDYGCLQNLDLSHNFLTGVIPPFLFQSVIQYTQRLKLNHNRLEGSLPTVPFPPSLTVLSLSNNQLSGQIPSSFRNLTNLLLLDLSHNKFEGNLENIPLFSNASSSQQQFFQLRVLLLGNNSFTGTIPTSLGEIAPALQLIDFSNNYLTGSIPVHALQSLPAFKVTYFPPSHGMVNLNVDVRGTLYEEIVITVKGNDQEYMYVVQALTALDLSNNKLSGPISTGMGELSGLVYLNLSRNNLSGHIPSDLERLGGQLQSLDMSFNDLDGHIPSSFQNLIRLAVFNVSYNKGLSGPILQTPQFDNKDSYIGDPNLCGIPILPNACPSPIQDAAGGTKASQDEPHKSLNRFASWIDKWIAIPGFVLGTAVGFLGVLCALKAFKM